MAAGLLERLVPTRRAADAPPLQPEPPADSHGAGSSLTAIRETVDLLEADLEGMIRDVQNSAAAVGAGVRSSAEVLATIEERSRALTSLAHGADRDAAQLANATEEFAQSSAAIGGQVREASALA